MSSCTGHITTETVFGQTLALWLGNGDEHHPLELDTTGLNVKGNLYLLLKCLPEMTGWQEGQSLPLFYSWRNTFLPPLLLLVRSISASFLAHLLPSNILLTPFLWPPLHLPCQSFFLLLLFTPEVAVL